MTRAMRTADEIDDARTPTQFAKGIAAAQLWAYIDAGQPMGDCGCDPPWCRRCNARVKAMEKLAKRLRAQSGDEP